MSKQTWITMPQDRVEIDRLRLLLDAMKRKTRRAAISIDLSPSAHGFHLVVTAPVEADEPKLAALIAKELQVLYAGAIRFAAAGAPLWNAADDGDVPTDEAITVAKGEDPL